MTEGSGQSETGRDIFARSQRDTGITSGRRRFIVKNLIEVQNLCKCYEDFTLEDIHLSVPAGCIVGLIGENGAGKTTTLKAILNIIRPDQGIIRLMGLSPEDPASRLQVGTVFEDSYFHDQLSPRQVCKIMNHIFTSCDPSLFDT